MKRLPFQKRTLALIAVIVPLLAFLSMWPCVRGRLLRYLLYWHSREQEHLTGAIRIGTMRLVTPTRLATFAGGSTFGCTRGERVKAGQVLGEMDPVDLDERIRAQNATRNEQTLN